MIATAALPAAARSLEGVLEDGALGAAAADELRRLVRRLHSAAGLAADAEAKEARAGARAWLRALRDALYQVGDAVHDFRRSADGDAARRLQQGRRSLRHLFMILPNVNGNGYKTFKTNIGRINVNMEGILHKGSELGLLSLPINQEVMNPMPEFSWDVAAANGTVGDIENEKNNLIDILVDRQSTNIVTTIVGDSGIGKTTLARKIQDDHRIRNAFSAVVWVSVVNDFNGITLLSAIVRATGGNTRGPENRMQLEAMLIAILKGKRLLLVLDDVRDHQIYDNFLEAQWHIHGCGSRILITTRHEVISTKVKASYVHRVKKLSFQDCWSLLCHNACLDEKNPHSNTLRNIGIMIIQKCNRLPMAVKIIGAVLRTKERTKEAWQRVYESEGWSFKDLPDDVHGLTGVIYLGYHDLSSHLKQCFLYLSLFPEGSIIRQQFVSQLWVSEGFIEKRGNCNLENTTEEYYTELVSRNLLQPEYGNHDITRCTMHDQIRSFLQLLAKDKIFSGSMEPSINGTSNRELRHVWIRSNGTSTLEEIGAVTSLKTVILYKYPLGSRGLDMIFKGLKYLQVLDLGGTDIRYIPRTLEFLLHLRFLNLSLTRITELPESIEYLKNLQFLGLRYCNWLHTLPKGIGKLQNLRNLDLRGTNLFQVLPSLVNLKQLSTLHGFTVNRTAKSDDDPSGWPLEDLKSLNLLRSLQILKIERVSDRSRAQEAKMMMKDHLKELELCCSSDDRKTDVKEEDARAIEDIFDCLSPPACLKSLKIVSYYGKLCPNWLPDLINLQQLVLNDCKFCEHLPDLGKLTQLKFLTIIGCSKLITIEQQRTGANQAFCKLERLHLKDMPNLESWTGFVPGDMPSLVKFRLESCPKLRHLPPGLNYSKVLKSVQIHHADSLQVIKDLPALKELYLQACNELTRISNIRLLEALTVLGCSRLKDVNEVPHLSHVRIMDREIRELPVWLATHASSLQTFTIMGTAELLKRLFPDGDDWKIIRDINKVYANLPDESPLFTYNKNSADFHVEQRIEQMKPPAISVAGIAHEAPDIPLDNSFDMICQIDVPRVPVRRISKLRRVIRQYLVRYLIMVMIVIQVLSYLFQNRTAREIWLIQTLLIFFATVFLLFLVYVD